MAQLEQLKRGHLVGHLTPVSVWRLVLVILLISGVAFCLGTVRLASCTD